MPGRRPCRPAVEQQWKSALRLAYASRPVEPARQFWARRPTHGLDRVDRLTEEVVEQLAHAWDVALAGMPRERIDLPACPEGRRRERSRGPLPASGGTGSALLGFAHLRPGRGFRAPHRGTMPLGSR